MCICMIFTLLPFSVFADNTAGDAEQSVSVESSGDNGVKLKKTVAKQDDDTYKVTLEQYVTGTVTPGKATPIDVVLVLDVSGSMAETQESFTSITYEATYNVTAYRDSYGHGHGYEKNTYYVQVGDEYKAVQWCDKCRAYADANQWQHEKWDRDKRDYVVLHTTKYTPKTSADDTAANHVQFFELKNSTTEITKLDALKNAVNGFINTIAEKNSDSRIAIVKFASNKSTQTGNDTYEMTYWGKKINENYTQIVKTLTAVNNTTNVTALKNAVTALNAGGATHADWGLEKAQEAFGTATAPADRQRVVIMFTDGVPTSTDTFDEDVANTAISNAKTLKSDTYGAKVYTIAVYKDATVSDMLPGDYGINRYMHLVSSNYPTATSMSSTGDGNPKGGYYMVAANEKELSDAFTKIGDAEGTPAIDLGSTAVLTDVVAGNFKAPANTTDVKVYTEDHDGNGSFSNRQELSDARVSISGQSVTVTGFDYSANYVSTEVHPNTTNDYGKKLVVEFTIKVDRDKTYGGTQPTNAGADIKPAPDKDPVASVENPVMPVSITQPNISDVKKTKPYDGDGFDIKSVFENEIASAVPTDGSKNEYVTITYTIKDSEGNEVGTYTIADKGTNGKWDPATDLTTPADVGEYNYTVICTISDAKTDNPHAATVSADGTMKFTITERGGLTVAGTAYNDMYDGDSHGEAAVAMIDGKPVTDGVTIKYKVDNGEWTTTVPTVKDVADSTTVQVKAEKTGYKTAEATYTLTVTQRQVTLTSDSASKPYDGTPLTRPNVTVSGDGFVEGEVSDIKAIGTVTNISDGEVDNTITYTKNQSFKASNYDITEKIGKLSIVSPNTVVVTIKGNEETVIYNGKEKTATGYTVESISSEVYTSADFKLADGSAAEVKAVNAKATPYYMGLTADSFVNINPNFSEVVFVVTDGSLTINPRPLIIEGESSDPATITYDGQEHSYSKFWAVETDENSGLVLDHKIAGDIKYLLTGKNASSYTGAFTGAAKIMSGEEDVTENYIIEYAPGEMTIVPAEKIVVKIIGNHKEVTYNGQEQSVNGFEYEVDDETVKVALKEGHYAIATGTDANKTYYMYLSDDDFVVTHNNYKEVSIEIVDGWLKINPRTPVRPPVITDRITVTITGNSDNVVYDGTEHNVKGYTVEISDSRYTEKDFTFSGKDIASGVNAGSYEMGLKADQFKNLNGGFSNIEFVIKADGVLTITPMDLTITAGSKDGIAPVTCNEYESTDLAKGDVIESVKITGEQLEPGQSPNVASDAVIKNAKGEDVTKNYNIKYVDGTLKAVEPLNKEDHFNYIVGYTDGTIRPNNNITRAEVAAIFFRLLTDEARSTFMTDDCSFSDVAQGAWCRRSIATLTNAEIISGYTDGTFKPNAPITRAELATIIARFAKLDVNTKTFSDINGHWAQKYIELAAGNGWIDGYTDGTFRPNQNIKRAETFAMINRVLDRVTESNSDLLPTDQMNMWSDNMDFDAWYYRDVQEATNNHKAERVGDSIYEKWTEKLPDIDWAAIQL